MTDTRTNIEKIKSIFHDYARYISYDDYSITLEELNEIAKRIETEVMGVVDDNEFVGLKDLTKEK